MIRITVILAVFSLLSAPIFAQSTISKTMTHGGIQRAYRLYIPASYNSAKPSPVVFNLHGYGSDNTQQETYGNFKPIADTAGFIIVHPNGTLDANNQRHWNAFGFGSVDDIGFISAIIDTLKNLYNINENRIYSTGMSNGGFMSYELACNLSNRITAVASVTGSMTWQKMNTCNPGMPVPVMQIHGTADATVPYAGSTSFAHIDSLVTFWVKKNNCNLSPIATPVPNTNTTDGCTADHYLYGNGSLGSTVEFYKVNGGGHSWPGASINLNVTNMDFSASKEIWRFFSQYSKNNFTVNTQNLPDGPLASIYPVPFNDILNIEMNDNKFLSISVMDLRGRDIPVTMIQESSGKTVLNTNGWEKGIYFIAIKSASQTSYFKVVKN
jgi:polyhydroxybutyrate depolymerase